LALTVLAGFSSGALAQQPPEPPRNFKTIEYDPSANSLDVAFQQNGGTTNFSYSFRAWMEDDPQPDTWTGLTVTGTSRNWVYSTFPSISGQGDWIVRLRSCGTSGGCVHLPVKRLVQDVDRLG